MRDPEIVGREEALRAISSFLEQSTASRALVIEGEAGIGKTTLWRRAVRTASDNGCRILEARPSAAESGLAFSGLVDLLASSLDPIRDELPAPQLTALEVALLRRDAEERPADPRVVSTGVLSALRALATNNSIVVAVDDVQWLDRESAAAIAYAFRRLDVQPVRLIASLRLDPALPSSELLESMAPELTTYVRVGALSPGVLHRVIRLHLDRTLSRPVLLRVHALAAGNPFYALELARSLPDDPGPDLALPLSLERLTHERLRRLTAPVRRLLEPAALLANPTVTLLEGLGETGPAGEYLDRAVAAGVIEIEADRIRFTHPLLAEGMAEMIGLGAVVASTASSPSWSPISRNGLAISRSRPMRRTRKWPERSRRRLGIRVAEARPTRPPSSPNTPEDSRRPKTATTFGDAAWRRPSTTSMRAMPHVPQTCYEKSSLPRHPARIAPSSSTACRR